MELQYTIAQGNSIEKLLKEVELRISEGWLPQGGVAVGNGSSFIFAQAMIKKSE